MKPMETEQDQSGTGTNNLETFQLPKKAKVKKHLRTAVIVSNGKFFFKRFAVMNSKGELITKFVLTKSNYQNVKCFGYQSILLPHGNAWKICDLNGKPFVDNMYDDVVELKSSCLAVGQKNVQTQTVKYALANINGNPNTGFDYLNIGAFSEGLAIAKGEKKTDVLDTNGKIIVSMNNVKMRKFRNGYAVFERGGLWGAINTSGKLIFQPRFAWLSDCDFECFRYSNDSNSTRESNMGIVNSTGSIVLNTSRGFKDLTILNEKDIMHSRTFLYETNENNNRVMNKISAIGFITDNITTQPIYLFIGEEREGLRAFVSYTQSSPHPIPVSGRFLIGYMDSNFNNVFTIVDYTTKDGFDFGQLWVRDYRFYLSPFINGTAVVQIQQGEIKAFLGSTFFCKNPYVIDRTGNRVTDAVIVQQRLKLKTTSGIKNESVREICQPIAGSTTKTDFPQKTTHSTVKYDDNGKMVSVDVIQGTWSLQTNGDSKYNSQKADSLLVASEILKQLTSIPPQTYYLVDTPDGTLGRDINGFFTESSIKTTNLKIDNPCEQTESIQSQSLMGFGNMMNNQNSVALLKTSGQYAKLILMMKCGKCDYESPIETIAGNMERQCYCCGTNNKTNRGTINVYTANGIIEV